jgi:Cu/Ag efflux protein CusF
VPQYPRSDRRNSEHVLRIRAFMCAAAAATAITFNLDRVQALSPGGSQISRPQHTALLPVQDSNGLFRGIGVVTAVDPTNGSLTVNHQEIVGLMPPMEMLFDVSPRSLSDGVRPGDKIKFQLENKTYTIRDLKVVERTN